MLQALLTNFRLSVLELALTFIQLIEFASRSRMSETIALPVSVKVGLESDVNFLNMVIKREPLAMGYPANTGRLASANARRKAVVRDLLKWVASRCLSTSSREMPNKRVCWPNRRFPRLISRQHGDHSRPAIRFTRRCASFCVSC